MDKIRIVLAGQPNVGKSMLINSMSGLNNLKVGNFAGVTVEKTELEFNYKDYLIEMIDLPGTYSIEGFSQEEKVAHRYLINEEYDVIINVVDSTRIQRNLLLTLELLNLNKKMVIALNMADEAQKEGIEIDVEQLSKIIGVPVVMVSAKDNKGIDELLDSAIKVAKEKNRRHSNIVYSDAMEEEIIEISNFLNQKGFKLEGLTSREIAIGLLFEDKEIYKKLHEEPIMLELQPIIISSLKHLYTHHETKNIQEIKANEYMAIARGIRMETVKCNTHRAKRKNLTRQIDEILIHKYWGIPIFLFFMWGLFQITFKFSAIPMNWIDAGFHSFGDLVGSFIDNELLRSLIVDGIISGVGAVIMFLPSIIFLYIGISLLETTGYMSRVAFLLDGFFHKFGLHGKSFIPLVTGFGCSVPAYMAARTLKSEKDRLITLFIIGFMSCGARLPIYVLFTGIFFSQAEAGSVLFLIYISGAILGLVMAKLLRVFVFKGEDEPFVMEMPKYRLPSFKLIFHTVYNNAKSYVKKAGTFILLASVLIWFASNNPKLPELEKEYQTKIEQATTSEEKISLSNDLKLKRLENSFLGQIGKVTEPFFAPLGFNWKMSVALETGLAAKEVVVSTLGVLYSVRDQVDTKKSDNSLAKALKSEISFASAISFIVFVMIYLPCFAASMVFVKEAGGFKYLVYLFIFTTATAWILSFVTYHLLLFFA